MEIEKVNEDRMHGSIFVLLKRFIEHTYDFSTWVNLKEATGVEHAAYQMQEMYPTQEMVSIVLKASEMTGVSTYELLEQFGQYLVPDLLLVYKKYVDPTWSTYDLLLNTEHTMHGAVRRQDNRTNPPMLVVTKQGDSQLDIAYHSKRRMAGVAVGIIKGIINYYEEEDTVQVTCLTPPDEKRVQIRVDFLKKEDSEGSNLSKITVPLQEP